MCCGKEGIKVASDRATSPDRRSWENETDMDGKLAMLVEKANKFPEVTYY